MTSITRPLCISSDSHVVEPPELFEPLVKRFGEEAPHIVQREDIGPQMYIGGGRWGFVITGFLQAGFDFGRPDAAEVKKMGYDLARPGVYDIKERLEDQDLDGLDAEVIYPSIIFDVYKVQDLDILKATFSTYNDWTADYCKEAPDRLFPLACVQLYDLDEAIEEMHRAKDLGHVGLCIAATAPPDRPYSDPWYDKFWAAAQEAQMPLTMHIFTGATPNHGMPHRAAASALAFTGMTFTIYDLIYGGVLERFPDLKFVITEFETGWIAMTLNRLDWNWFRGGGARTMPTPQKPSYYWKRNFLATLEDDILGIRTRDVIGVGSLMWGSDYPHGDSVFPDSQGVLDRIMDGVPVEERYAMTAKNVVDLYSLPFEA
jgi:predicted TIM-barrel fold metal-dependent hydrolase